VTDVDHKSKQLCRYCSVLIEDEKKRLKNRNKTEGNVR
jgi:predicted Zn-dependent protease